MTKTTLRNLIAALCIFAVVVGGVLFTFTNILSNSQTLEQQIEAVAAQNKQEESLLRLQRIAQSSEEERAELESYFLLREGDSIAFLSEVEALAPQLGLSLQTVTLEQVDEDNKKWIEVTFSVQGQKYEVQEFVGVMETVPYVSRLKSVLLNGTRDGDWEATIIIQVQLLQYAD